MNVNALLDVHVMPLSTLGDASCRLNPGRPLADELLQLLLTSDQGGSLSPRKRIDAVLDELVSVEGLPFQEQLLQGGPWRVSDAWNQRGRRVETSSWKLNVRSRGCSVCVCGGGPPAVVSVGKMHG